MNLETRPCTRHPHEPIEAELLVVGRKFDRIMLRCPVCDRPRGERLVRKAVTA